MHAANYLEFIARVFSEKKIDAIMIGNAAAALQGAPVTTVDIDFLFNQKMLVETFRNLVAIAQEYGYTFMSRPWPSYVPSRRKIDRFYD